jgi:hypothetical protein
LYDPIMSLVAEPFAYEDELAEVAGIVNAQHARLVRVAARAQRDGGWFGEGIHSIRHWLTIHLGVSPGRAGQLDTIASRADEFPVLMAAFDRGELSIDQVYEVAARAPGWADQHVTEFALVATVAQLRRMIRDEHFDGDPDQPQPDPPQPAQSVSLSWDEHSRLRLSGSLDTEQGRVFEGAAHEIRDALFHTGHTDVTWADVLAEMARRSLSPVDEARRNRFLPQVHVHLDTGATQLTNGVPLPPALADYLLCDSVLRPVWERDCVAFGVGRRQRSVPEPMRRIVEHRDQGCRTPGCHARHVHIHHIIHWSRGGVTETWNIISVCPHHHKLHHLGLLHISGNADTPDGVTFTDHTGRPLATHPQPRPPGEQSPPPPAVPYRHPSGERLQTKWVGLGWAHPNALTKRRQRVATHHQQRTTGPADASTGVDRS